MKKSRVIDDRTASRTAVVVLGGGTAAGSAAQDLLAALGCDAPASAQGARGSIAELNEAILLSAGIASPRWAPFYDQWLRSRKAEEFLQRAMDLLQAEYGDSYLLVMHAPSTARLLPFWQLVFERSGIAARYVNVVTDPIDPANGSLQPSDESAEAQLVWLRDNLDAERSSRRQPRVFVASEQLAADPMATIDRLSKGLGLVFPREPQAAFSSSSPRLKNFREWASRTAAVSRLTATEYPRADWIAVTLETLKRWSREGEDARGCKSLDAVRTAFDQAIPAFLHVRLPNLAAAATKGEVIGGSSGPADFGRGRHAREELRAVAPKPAKAVEELEAQLESRFGEIVTLTRLLAAERSAARRFEGAAARLAAIAIAFQRGAGGRRKSLKAMMPWRWHLKTVERRLERENLFNSAAYLKANPDVARAGMNPLAHYLMHGMAEGRPIGID